MARSLSDGDCCNCSSAEAGVCDADFLFGPMLANYLCYRKRGVRMCLMSLVFVLVGCAARRKANKR